jgi:hypothetical protein
MSGDPMLNRTKVLCLRPCTSSMAVSLEGHSSNTCILPAGQERQTVAFHCGSLALYRQSVQIIKPSDKSWEPSGNGGGLHDHIAAKYESRVGTFWPKWRVLLLAARFP